VSADPIGEMIHGYFTSTAKAISTLFEHELLGHMLILIYSALDTCGLLDAPPEQEQATSGSFKSWVTKYLLPNSDDDFDAVDLWAARCAVLHTFTSESNLSRSGSARELQYYTGDKSAPHIQRFITFTKGYQGGKHLPVHLGDFCGAALKAMMAFVPDLEANCASSSRHAARLRKVIQMHVNDAAAP